MQHSNPKYSLLIPARNGGRYLPTCIETIVSQHYDDYELIVSDDHSNDDSDAYLRGLNHPNVRVLHPPESLSMAAHWEWVLSQSRGQWLMFVGQDDGVQPYFFELADKLVTYANDRRIRTISSARAYYFWQGCEEFYGNHAVLYSAASKLKMLNFGCQAALTLLSIQSYFDLPQMYTTSIFRRDILEEVRRRQSGRVFTTHPQDANLAAIAFSLERRYLRCLIPLGWVGSSPKSAGLAVSAGSVEGSHDAARAEIDSLRKEYLGKISESKLLYHPLAGDFSLSSSAIYFWAALLCTQHLRRPWVNRLLASRVLKTVTFGGVLAEISATKEQHEERRMKMFNEMMERNKCNHSLVKAVSRVYPLARKAGKRLSSVANRIAHALHRRNTPSVRYSVSRRKNQGVDLISASKKVDELVQTSRLIDGL